MSKSIPHDKFLNGIRLCRRNAKRLLLLADEAYSKECFHASFLLGFASLEETGKAVIILNHINDECITFEKYKNELKNHDKKILEALKMEHENILEVFRLGFREAFLKELKSTEPKEKDIKEITDIRLDSIYVDYDFIENGWKKPKKDVKQDAWNILIKSFDAYNCFLNECKHRGVRLRKKANPLFNKHFMVGGELR